MKTNKIFRKLCFAVIVSVLAEPSLLAESASEKEELRINIEQERSKEERRARNELYKNALGAVEETAEALKALEENDSQRAIEYLEKVVGKLELILAREPSLALIPIDAQVESLNLMRDLENVEKLKKEAESLVKKGYLPQARRLLNLLASEIKVTTYMKSIALVSLLQKHILSNRRKSD